MKTLIKIFLILVIPVVLLTSSLGAKPALALCLSACNPSPLIKLCLPTACDDCGWCAPSGDKGIYNPVISPNVGRGVGAGIIAKFIAEFMSIAFILAGLVLLAMILFSGFEWITAGGDQNKLKSAQGRLTSALIGFTILVAARAILGFIAGPLGVPWLDTLKIVWPTP